MGTIALLGAGLGAPAASGLAAETIAFEATLASNGGAALSSGDETSLNNFFVSATANSYWSKLKRLYVGGMPSQIAGSIDFRNQTTSLAQVHGSNFVTWTLNSGWSPNNLSNASLNLQFNPSTGWGQDDAGYGAYFKGLSADTDNDMGSGSSQLNLFRILNSNSIRFRINNSSNISISPTTGAGFWHVNRSGASSIQVYGPSGTSVATNSTASTANTDTAFYFGAAGSGTMPDRYAPAFWLTSSLTATEAQDLRDHIVTLLTALGSN